MKATHLLSLSTAFALLIVAGCSVSEAPDTEFMTEDQQIKVILGGEHFTTYRFDDDFAKPVLYPVYAPSQVRIQRAYPLEAIPDESDDHPHHFGVFFTYGSLGEVNGNNYWQDNEPPTRIAHQEVTQEAITPEQAILGTRSHWIDKDGSVLMVEERMMIFEHTETERSIDFTIDLTALDEAVTFEDTKEGMFAIRVADWLREKTGNASYLSSRGGQSADDIWGRRAEWVRLEGEYEGRMIGIAILNHPESVNYPTYWHARAYGLFSANPLGQSVFEKAHGNNDAKPFNFRIPTGETARFKYKLIVYEGSMGSEEMSAAYANYTR